MCDNRFSRRRSAKSLRLHHTTPLLKFNFFFLKNQAAQIKISIFLTLRPPWREIRFRRRAAETRVMTLFVIKSEVSRKVLAAVGYVGVILQIDFFIFYRPPKSLDHNIVKRTPSTVHTDLKRVSFKRCDELVTRILRPLIRIEDSGTSEPKRVFHALNAEFALKRC